MTRHNSNHKGKAEGCEACRLESEFDKLSKTVRKLNHKNKTRYEYDWETEKGTSHSRRPSKRYAS